MSVDCNWYWSRWFFGVNVERELFYGEAMVGLFFGPFAVFFSWETK